MALTFQTISPVDGKPLVERPWASETDLEQALARAERSRTAWAATPLSERRASVGRFVDAILDRRAELETELTQQMGRPIRFAPGEMNGFAERARTMSALSETALGPLELEGPEGFRRFITREPLGTVLVLAPWNYPWLTSVNAIVPALLAGNVVLLKHSDQTPLVAERYADAAKEASLPEGVFQALHLSHEYVARAIKDLRVHHVMFTGSVDGGLAVKGAAASRFIGCGLELGGKDPAYVRADAELSHAVPNVVDGSFFNSGQSCCGIERIYVHRDVYKPFVETCLEEVASYVLGDPTDEATTLGPVVRKSNADRIRRQIEAAVHQGARTLIDPASFPTADLGPQYLAPQILVDVHHEMEIMQEETFGPVVGIMRVDDDDQAIALMNDSRYGLTASIWTQDEAAALRIGRGLETGTCFVNRADYLDPELAWVGVKDSGRGCTLSRIGFEHLTRPKSYHVRTVPASSR